MKTLIKTAAVASLALLAAPLSAQPFDAKGKAGGWNVFYNQATGGCFIERGTEQGVVMQIGTEAGMQTGSEWDSFGFFAVYVQGEAPEVDSDTPAAVVMLDGNVYTGEAHRVVREGYYGGYFLGGGATNIAEDLAKAKQMTIVTANGAEVIINLNQSNVKKALRAAGKCQDEYS